MGVSAEWFWNLAVGVIGFLVALVLHDFKQNLKDLWREIEKLREHANDCDGRADLAEQREKYALERIASLEARTRQ